MNKVSYAELKARINNHAWDVSVTRTETYNTYKFKITHTQAAQVVAQWALETHHLLNWSVTDNYTFTYTVKSSTPISETLEKIIQSEELQKKNTPTTTYKQEYTMNFNEKKAVPVRTSNEINIQEHVTIDGIVFNVPNDDIILAEDKLMELSAQLVFLKAQRKERKKAFENGLPLVLQRKYNLEIGSIRYAIDLIDEITEFEE